MSNNNQAAQLARTGTDSSVVTSTNCSICRGKNAEKREAVNRSLAKGISLRDIEAMTNISYRTIGNHAQHLPEIFREAKEKGILNQAIDVETEFREQLAFAKDLRTSARKYLSDPETGEITLIPRGDEITVIYEDMTDRDNAGNPKRKRDTLDKLIERIEQNNTVTALQAVAKHVDIRSFALDSLKVADIIIDKFAKIAGSYAKDNAQKNPASVINFANVRLQLINDVKRMGIPPELLQEAYDIAANAFINKKREFGETIRFEDLKVQSWELVG